MKVLSINFSFIPAHRAPERFQLSPNYEVFPFIYRLWFRAYTYCFKIRRDKGVKSLEHFLCTPDIFLPPPAADFLWQQSPTKRRLRAVELAHFSTAVPITGTPHRCGETLCVTADGDRCKVQQTGRHKAAWPETQSWTSEPPRTDVKGPIARSNILEVTGGKNVSVVHILLLIAAWPQIPLTRSKDPGSCFWMIFGGTETLKKKVQRLVLAWVGFIEEKVHRTEHDHSLLWISLQKMKENFGGMQCKWLISTLVWIKRKISVKFYNKCILFKQQCDFK